jgi:hypothetical protein
LIDVYDTTFYGNEPDMLLLRLRLHSPHVKLLIIVFCSDATGSMGGYLASIRSILQQICRISALSNCAKEVAIFLYRDYCDPVATQFVWSGWKENPAELAPFIAGAQAQGGGDTPEAVRGAVWKLREHLDEVPQDGAPVLVIWFADAPPHEASHRQEKTMLGEQRFDWIACCDALSGFCVCPVITSCERDEAFFGTLAERTGGICMMSHVFSSAPLQIASAALGALAFFVGLEPPTLSAKISQVRVDHATEWTREAEMPLTGFRLTPNLEWPRRRLGVETHELLDAFTEDPEYREVVYAQFEALVRDPLGVLSLAQLPWLGKLWRLIQRRRLDERRIPLVGEMQKTIPLVTDPEGKTIVSAWIADSYNYADEILAAVEEAPSPIPALTCDEPGDISRAELLEIGRSTAPDVLEKVGALLSHLQIVTAVPKAAPFLPLSLPDEQLFEYLPHVLFPGTLFSRRLAVLLAVLALKTHNVLLAERAERFIESVKGTWLIRAEIEDNSGQFLEFTLRAPVDIYTAEERAFVERQYLTYALSVAQNRRVGARLLAAPKIRERTACETLECVRCHQQRSVTTMTVDGVCGVCVAPVRLRPLPAEEPGKCHLVSCSQCQGIYEVVNIDRLRCKPKCHFCREHQTVTRVRCDRCHLQFLDPTNKFQAGGFRCHRCREPTAIPETEVTVSQLMEDRHFRAALLSRLGLPHADYSRILGRVSNKLFYAPVVEAPSSLADISLNGQIVADPSEVIERAAAAVQEGKRETRECLLCFRDVDADEVVSACGRKDCAGVACRGCLGKWYGAVRPGECVCLSTLHCPFCRRFPAMKTISTFNRRALAIAAQSEAFDPAFHYAWCSGACYKIVPAVEKSCQQDLPNYRGTFVCEGCRASKLREATAAVTKVTPCCHIRVEKTGGCDHMRCRCGAHFCWRCLTVLREEEVYEHIARHTGVYRDEPDEEDY